MSLVGLGARQIFILCTLYRKKKLFTPQEIYKRLVVDFSNALSFVDAEQDLKSLIMSGFIEIHTWYGGARLYQLSPAGVVGAKKLCKV